jgi:putative protein kinase ArgK-like GTPase of G3E family
MIQAFQTRGPLFYVGALGTVGFFPITGPTGAGKSTLLDAITQV